MSNLVLRNVNEDDLPIFFKHQRDSEANQMAAFTSKDPNDWNSFAEHWNKILTNKNIIKQTIIVENTVVGHIVHLEQFGEPEVPNWIGKEYWVKGIATNALREFLKQATICPFYTLAT